MKSVFAKQIVIEHPLCRHFSPVQWRSACGLRGLLLTLRVPLVSTLPAEWAYELFNSVLFPLLSSPGSCSVCYSVPCQALLALALRHPSDLLSAPVICSGCPGLCAVSQAASECLSEDFSVCSPQHLEPFLQNAPWRSRALLPHHKLSLTFYLQCLRLPLSRQLLFMHSPYCYLTVLFLVYC